MGLRYMKHSKVIVFVLLLCTIDVFAKKEIIIDLTKQKLYAIKDGNITMNTNVSTGKKGHYTPAGKFKILEKKRHHISTIYNLPMPYMLRLTNGGIAIHQGYVPNYPASHGCIRVPKQFAEELFYWTPVGTIVHVKHNVPDIDLNKTIETNSTKQQIVFDVNKKI